MRAQKLTNINTNTLQAAAAAAAADDEERLAAVAAAKLLRQQQYQVTYLLWSFLFRALCSRDSLLHAQKQSLLDNIAPSLHLAVS
jgi:hypothetical protein